MQYTFRTREIALKIQKQPCDDNGNTYIEKGKLFHNLRQKLL